MKKTSKMFYAALLAVTAALPLPAAEIIAVNRLAESRGDISSGRNMSVHGMDKFTVRELPSGREVFLVTWAPGREAVPAGSVMVFEYQRATETKLRSQSVKFPMEVRSQRETTFETSSDGARFFGDVGRWRVTLRQGDRLLAEKASESWED